MYSFILIPSAKFCVLRVNQFQPITKHPTHPLLQHVQAVRDARLEGHVDQQQHRAGAQQAGVGLVCDIRGMVCDIRKRMGFEHKNEKNVCSSFHLLSLFDSPLLQYKNSKLENKHYRQKNNINLILKKKTKIRIAYYSADFCDHPVLHLIFDVFKNHNKNKFEIFAFSFGPRKKMK